LGQQEFFRVSAFFAARSRPNWRVPTAGHGRSSASRIEPECRRCGPRNSLKRPISTDSTDGHRERTCPKSVLPTDSDPGFAGVGSNHEQGGHGCPLRRPPQGPGEAACGLGAIAGDLPAGARAGELFVAAARSSGCTGLRGPARNSASACNFQFDAAANPAATNRPGTHSDILRRIRSATEAANSHVLRSNQLVGRARRLEP